MLCISGYDPCLVEALTKLNFDVINYTLTWEVFEFCRGNGQINSKFSEENHLSMCFISLTETVSVARCLRVASWVDNSTQNTEPDHLHFTCMYWVQWNSWSNFVWVDANFMVKRYKWWTTQINQHEEYSFWMRFLRWNHPDCSFIWILLFLITCRCRDALTFKDALQWSLTFETFEHGTTNCSNWCEDRPLKFDAKNCSKDNVQ